MERLERIEERLSHALRALDDLSDTVARQNSDIARLTRQVQLLMAREAERGAEGAQVFGDERPPHY